MRENLKFKAWVGKNEEVYTDVNDGVFIPPTTQKKTLDFSRVLVSGNSRVLRRLVVIESLKLLKMLSLLLCSFSSKVEEFFCTLGEGTCK